MLNNSSKRRASRLPPLRGSFTDFSLMSRKSLKGEPITRSLAPMTDDDDRVGILENLIIVAHRQMRRMPTEEPYYAQVRSRVEEYQREYKVITGEYYTGAGNDDSFEQVAGRRRASERNDM